MVKKFIASILGKKEDLSKGSEEEVPEELPPLAEDILKQSSDEPKKEAKAADSSQKAPQEEVPEELPPLEDAISQIKTQDSAEQGTIDDLEKENIPQEVKNAKLAKTRAPPAKTAMELKTEDVQKAKENYSVAERIKSGAEIGFFSNILEHVKKHGGAKEKLLSGDLFLRMGSYWELRKHEIKTGTALPAEKKLEEDVLKKLQELSNLEQKWQVQKLALEEDMKYIHEREREIQAKVNELKMTSNELGLFRNVKPEEYFYMQNGVVLKNLHDLIDILEVIDEETYNFHVRNNKNDFSDWIRHIFKNNNLADSIKDAKTKLEIIEILEKIPLNEESEKPNIYTVMNPKKYFWMENGVVIRNLYEMSDALKVMDDELFKKHVSENKNDFAKWIADVFKNEHLTEKLKNAKTRKEIVDILEVFL